jgi:hypothetical protein
MGRSRQARFSRRGIRGLQSNLLKNMVGTRRLELLTSTVSKFKYSVIQQLTGYPGLPKSLIILHNLLRKRNRCGTESLRPLLSGFAGFERF